MSSDNWWFIPTFFVSMALMIICTIMGEKIGTSGVYERCLTKNGHMVYTDAIKYCKEFVYK